MTYKEPVFINHCAPLQTLFISYLHESNYLPNAPKLKIKNLYFENVYASSRPSTPFFFTCPFDGYDTWSETHQIANDGESFPKNLAYPLPVSILNDQKGSYIAEIKMLYQNGPDNWTGSDGSGYLSSELFHGLWVKSPMEYKDEFEGQNVVLAFQNIHIPKDAMKIKIECLVTTDPGITILTGDPSEQIPMYIQFDNGEKTQFFKDSIINGVYTYELDEVVVPKGAETLTILMEAHPTISYIVDNLVLSSDNPLQGCGDYIGLLDNLSDDFTISVSPNPATDVVNIVGVDAVESVELFSLSGLYVSCRVDNASINVSDLASGEYVVVINHSLKGRFVKK